MRSHACVVLSPQEDSPLEGRHAWILRAAIVVCIVLGASRLLAAEPGGPALWQGSSHGEVRDQAIQAMPLDRLSGPARAKADGVLANVSVFRRMPTRVIDCDPELYLFLLRHPDVVVDIWETLGMSQVKAKQVGDGKYDVTDQAGTKGTVEFLYRSHDTHLIFAEGSYEGVLSLRPVHGKLLLSVRSGYVRETDGRYYVTTRLDSFMNVEPGAVEVVTKTIQPIMGKIADANFVQSLAFVGSLSRTAEVNPAGVQRLAGKLNDVQAESRNELCTLAERIGQQAELQAERKIEAKRR